MGFDHRRVVVGIGQLARDDSKFMKVSQRRLGEITNVFPPAVLTYCSFRKLLSVWPVEVSDSINFVAHFLTVFAE